jgi:lipoprotein-releasing system ATP-binding protein
MQALLKAEKIHKKFFSPQTVTVLKEVSLDVFPSDSVAIMGASGEGKSTLLQILGTLEPFSSGKLQIANENVTTKNAPRIRNKHIGFVFQAFHLLENYTALENVLMPARIAGLDTSKGSKTFKRANELFEKVGLQDRLNYRTNLLSGGEKQRVSIARALCMDPSLILADEPSGNLDHTTAKQIHSLLLDLCKDENKGLIVVTHNLELASLCSRSYILRDGNLQ